MAGQTLFQAQGPGLAEIGGGTRQTTFGGAFLFLELIIILIPGKLSLIFYRFNFIMGTVAYYFLLWSRRP
jgi:hypothetical protein